MKMTKKERQKWKKNDNEDEDDLQEIVDGVLQIEEKVPPGLVRPGWEIFHQLFFFKSVIVVAWIKSEKMTQAL